MSDPFRGAWLKLGWAVRHAHALHHELAEHAATVDGSTLFTIRPEYDAKAHCVKTVVNTVEEPPVTWTLRLGDVVNNLRASLDHIAWQLVQRGSSWPLKPRQERSVYFPIADSRDRFDELCRNHLPGLLRRDKALIRHFQPYMGGKRNLSRHCLTPLPQMSSDDKHRELRPVWSAPSEGELEYSSPSDCVITRIPDVAKRIVLNPNQEIQRIYVRRTGPNPRIDVKLTLAFKPIIDGPIWLDDWLGVAPQHVGSLLKRLSPAPTELWDWGIVGPGTPQRV